MDAAWLTPKQVSVRLNRDIVTVYLALESGRMHGHQPCRKGRWSVAPAAADAYITGADGKRACACDQLRLVRKRA